MILKQRTKNENDHGPIRLAWLEYKLAVVWSFTSHFTSRRISRATESCTILVIPFIVHSNNGQHKKTLLEEKEFKTTHFLTLSCNFVCTGIHFNKNFPKFSIWKLGKSLIEEICERLLRPYNKIWQRHLIDHIVYGHRAFVHKSTVFIKLEEYMYMSV